MVKSIAIEMRQVRMKFKFNCSYLNIYVVRLFYYAITLAALAVLIDAIEVNCAFSDIENCVRNCYQCNVQKLVITRRNQTITTINGNHFKYDSNDNVVTLKIIDQLVFFLPSGFVNHFPFLSVLKIWTSGLRSIVQEDIRDMKYLTDFSLSGNDLETLNSNLFQFNQRLIKIDFTRNRLKHIGLNLLKPLKNLVYADFYRNDCIHDGARYSFEDLKTSLRKKCQPTNEMMAEEVELLSSEIESLNRELDIKEKLISTCEEEKNVHAKLDSIFPSILTGDMMVHDLGRRLN